MTSPFSEFAIKIFTLSHLKYNEARQKNQAKVVENHGAFQLEGFAVGH